MTTYYVSSEIGNNKNAGTAASAPLDTLQAAANLVQPGDTVEVMNGTYTAPAGGNVLTITTSGTANAPIIFEAAPGQTPVINSSGAWNGISIQASHIVVDGFTVVGDAANYTLATASAEYSTGNANLDGNGITVSSPGNGVVPNHITIENNTVYNQPGGGIGTQGADYVQILNNVVYDNGHWSAYGNSGISIYTSANSDTNSGVHDIVSGNLVYGNAQLVPTSGDGKITDGEGIILDTNTGYVGEILVENNTVHGNGSSGIESFLTNNAVITGNTVYGNDTGKVQATSAAEIFINQSNNDTATNNSTTAPNVTPPVAPVISTGVENSNETLTLTGSAPAVSTVTVSDGGTTALGTAAATGGSWSFTTAALSAGSYAFTATDTTSAGTSATSSPFDVTVTPPPAVAPVVNSVVESPASGNLDAGKTVTLTLNMSENVTVNTAGGAPTLTLNDGGTATYTGGSGTDALTFSYTVAAGQNTSTLSATTVNLNGATITDGAGNAASLSLGGLTQAGPQIDTTAPAAPVIASDTVNGNDTVILSGTAVAASTVTVYDGQTALGTTTANASGAWKYTTGTLANGAQVFTATATDAAGNTSAASNAVDPTIGELTGVQAGTVSVANGTVLEITGTVDNTGTIALDATGSGADLAVVGSTTLTGSGTVTLSNNAGNVIGSNGAPATLTNVNNTIAGAGPIGDDDLTLINEGVIDANQTTALVINTGSNPVSNSGTLEATAGGGLDIESNVSNTSTIEAYGSNAKVVIDANVTNTTTGLLLASGSDAQVDLDNATIADGMLQTSGRNAFIETVSGSANALDGVAISSRSTVEINPGSTLTLTGTVANSGTLLVNGGLLDVDGALTGGVTELGGAGEAVMTQSSSENVDFLAKSTGELVLDQATRYTGQISGFKLSQSIDLIDIDFAAGVTLSYASNNSRNTGGVLTVTDGTNTAKLQMAGSYTLANFTVASDGNGGTLLTDPPVDTTNYTVANGTTQTIPTAAAGTETFVGNSGALVLDDSKGFGGRIAGFGGQDAILLSDLGFGSNTTLGYTANGSDSGTLTVRSGNQTVQLALLGNYMASSFVAASDGFGGTLITEAAQTTSHAPLTAPHAT